MRRYTFLILIALIILMFSSCITKDDISQLEDTLEELEDEYEETEDEYNALENELLDLETSLSEMINSNTALSAENEAALAENDKLSESVSQPPFQFRDVEFYEHMEIVSDEERLIRTYINLLDDDYSKESLSNGYERYTYVLEGDTDTDAYLTLSFLVGDYYREVYDIVAAYSSAEYEDEYNDLVQVLIASLEMITEDPYYYTDDYMDSVEDILEEGYYFYEYMTVTQEQGEDSGETRLFCTY